MSKKTPTEFRAALMALRSQREIILLSLDSNFCMLIHSDFLLEANYKTILKLPIKMVYLNVIQFNQVEINGYKLF